MYQTRQVPVASPLVGSPDPLRLPLTVLLALPAYPFHDPVDRRFNLPAAVGRLLGDSFGWERATRILAPRLWTPDWDAAALRQFVLTPSLGDELPLPGSLYHLDVESLRATAFPGLEASTYPIRIGVEPPRYPVVHFVGNLGWYRNDPTLDLGAPIRPELRPGVLRDALVEAETRLLILHIPPYNASGAERLAQYLVGGGVPAVLVVQSPDLATASAYFLNLYANLIHSLLLPDVARPTPEQERAGLNASLVYGEGAESVLQLNPYLDELHGRVRRVRETLEQQRQQVSALHDTQLRLLHRDQLEALAPRLRAVQDPLATLAGAVDFEENRLTQVRWMLHESQGAVPLSESAEVVPAIERSVQALAEQYPQLVQELHTEAARAPRVLNANFALPGSGRVLGPREGLAPGRDYDLLLDVGPRWTRIPSLVVGHADFPEEALPPDREGYVVDVVLVSEDFSPQIVSGQIWVPRGVGRSIPLVNGERADRPGPLALRLTTPRFPDGSRAASMLARARLCLYFENNLLQSARIQVGVVRAPEVTLEADNVVEVDYRLTGGFQDVEARFARRAVRFTPNEDSPGRPVAVNLTLNDDGAAGHRIVVKRRLDSAAGPPSTSAPLPPSNCPTQGWTPYDPAGVGPLVERARDQLLQCFYQKDSTGQVVRDNRGDPVVGLDPQTNGKPREQFKWDLVKLAELGSELFVKAFTQVRLEDDRCSQAQWAQNLLQVLSSATLIQVARTSAAQYVFPWALIYEHPLILANRASWRFCPIVDREWSEAGTRTSVELRAHCPYADSPSIAPGLPPYWHASDVICPYGFWGLKHVIEEPPSLSSGLGNAPNRVHAGPSLCLAVGATADPDLVARIQAHLDTIQQRRWAQLVPPSVADSWDTVTMMLQAPEIAYFLCHGEYDQEQGRAYLSVGPRDNLPARRIYAEDLAAWAVRPLPQGPDLAAWRKRSPLVFINGCHTADLKPGQLLSFVTTFAALGASGVLGTEVSVVLPVAIEVAESLFAKLAQPSPPPLGEALRQIRWELANKGNLLGLAYTLYGLADLAIVHDGG